MSFDVFALRDRVVKEYREYFESFVNIRDADTERFVRSRLEAGDQWPDAVLQLNPAYEPGPTLRELADSGTITRETARARRGSPRSPRVVGLAERPPRRSPRELG